MRRSIKKVFNIHPYKIEVGAGLISLANIITGAMVINLLIDKNNLSIGQIMLGIFLLLVFYIFAILIIKNERNNEFFK